MRTTHPDESRSCTFMNITNSCPRFGVQRLECYAREDGHLVEETAGYCSTYTCLMIHLSLLNRSNTNYTWLERELMQQYEPGQSLSNFVREYFLFVTNIVYKMAECGIRVLGSDLCKTIFMTDLISMAMMKCMMKNSGCRELKVFFTNPETFVAAFHKVDISRVSRGNTFRGRLDATYFTIDNLMENQRFMNIECESVMNALQSMNMIRD